MPSISEWSAYEKYIDSEIKKAALEEGKNIRGLECSIDGNKITYQHSPFDSALSGYFKRMYSEAGTKKQIKFFTSVFEDDKSVFLEYANRIGATKLEIEDLLPAEDNSILSSLYRGEKDDIIDKFLEENEETQKYIQYKIPSFIALIERAKSELKPILYIDFVVHPFEGLKHALAIICFLKDDVYNICIYDPMYFYRKNNKYEAPLTYAYFHYYLLAQKTGTPVKIINLSELCPETPKGKHCVQYQINAEYCSMYCLYFLYLYAKNDYPTEIDQLKGVIDQTFIVPVLSLDRKVCIETNIFKIKMMSFMLHVCILYAREYYEELYERFIEIAKELSEQTGIQLVSFPLEGGFRRSHRRRMRRQTKKYRRMGLKSRRRSRRFFV